MYNNDYYLQHFGVLGMKWGRRKSASEQKLDDMRKAEKTAEKGRKAEMKTHYDNVGKKMQGEKGDSDSVYFDKLSKAIDARDSASAAHKIDREAAKKAIGDQKALVKAEHAAAKAAKKASNMQKDENEAAEIRKLMRDELEQEVSWAPKEKQAALRTKLERERAKDLNYTADDVRRDRRELGLAVATMVVGVVGTMALSYAANKYAGASAGKSAMKALPPGLPIIDGKWK